MKRAGLFAVYSVLALVAIITLVPFAYLVCSSLKSKAVFFSSPFLPTSGLFDIEPSTGALELIDTSHLKGEGPHRFRLLVEAYDPRDKVVVDDVELAVSLSRETSEWRIVQLSAAGRTVAAVVDALELGEMSVQYRIADGNPRGFLGIAWGQLTGANYHKLLTGLDPPFLRLALNSFFFASVNACLATLFCAMGGYALAKFSFRGRAATTDIVLACLIVPGAVMLAPLYQLIYKLGLLDSYAGLILPGLAPAFGVYLFRQSMLNGLPNEMVEAARIDGCGEFRLFFTVALPMVRPMIGAFLLINYLGAWNNFIWPQIILQAPEKMPLAVGIAQLRDVYSVDYGMLMAGTLVSIFPVLCLFLLLQKEFIAGLTAGAVKG